MRGAMAIRGLRLLVLGLLGTTQSLLSPRLRLSRAPAPPGRWPGFARRAALLARIGDSELEEAYGTYNVTEDWGGPETSLELYGLPPLEMMPGAELELLDPVEEAAPRPPPQAPPQVPALEGGDLFAVVLGPFGDAVKSLGGAVGSAVASALAGDASKDTREEGAALETKSLLGDRFPLSLLQQAEPPAGAAEGAEGSTAVDGFVDDDDAAEPRRGPSPIRRVLSVTLLPLRFVGSAVDAVRGPRKTEAQRQQNPALRFPRRVDAGLAPQLGGKQRRGIGRRMGDFYRRRLSNIFRRQSTPWARVQSIDSVVGDRALNLMDDGRRRDRRRRRRRSQRETRRQRRENARRTEGGFSATAQDAGVGAPQALPAEPEYLGKPAPKPAADADEWQPQLPPNPLQMGVRLVNALQRKMNLDIPEIPVAVLGSDVAFQSAFRGRGAAAEPAGRLAAPPEAPEEDAPAPGRLRRFFRLGKREEEPPRPAPRAAVAPAPQADDDDLVATPIQAPRSAAPAREPRVAAEEEWSWGSLSFLNPATSSAPTAASDGAEQLVGSGTNALLEPANGAPPPEEGGDLQPRKISPEQVVMPDPDRALSRVPVRAAGTSAYDEDANLVEVVLRGVGKRVNQLRVRLGSSSAFVGSDGALAPGALGGGGITETAQAAILRKISRQRIAVAIETATELASREELEEFVIQEGLKTLLHGLEGGSFATRTDALIALAHVSAIDASAICSFLVQHDELVNDLVAMLEAAVDPLMQGVLWTANEVEYAEDAQIAISKLLLNIVLESETLTDKLRANPRLQKAIQSLVQRGSRRQEEPDMYAPLWSLEGLYGGGNRKGMGAAEGASGYRGKSRKGGKRKAAAAQAQAKAAAEAEGAASRGPGNPRKEARKRRKLRETEEKEARFAGQLESVREDPVIFGDADGELVGFPNSGDAGRERHSETASSGRKYEAEDGVDGLNLSVRAEAQPPGDDPDPNAAWSQSVNEALENITPGTAAPPPSADAAAGEEGGDAGSLWDSTTNALWNSTNSLWDISGLQSWATSPDLTNGAAEAEPSASGGAPSSGPDSGQSYSAILEAQTESLRDRDPGRAENMTTRAAELIVEAEEALEKGTNLPRPRSLPRDARSLGRVLNAALGFHRFAPRPGFPQQKGVRVLALDGGGARGVVAITQLKELRRRTGKEPHELFDVICGTSTGGIIAVLLGIRRMTIEDVERLYDILLAKIFQRFPGAGAKLVWSTAYYDERVWEAILTDILGTERLIYTNAAPNAPKVFCLSTVLSKNPARLMVWRTYNYPEQPEPSRYDGSFRYTVAEALRATTAAPTFFTPMARGDELYSDGAMIANNPAAVAVHEAQKLYPGVPIEAMVSVGTGRTVVPANVTRWGWDSTLNLLVNSATNTEIAHYTLQDTLPHSVYFRFNPAMEPGPIDEVRPEVLNELKRNATESFKDPEISDRLDELVRTLMGSGGERIPFI